MGGELSTYSDAILDAVHLAGIGVTVSVNVDGALRNVFVSDAAVEILGHSREALLTRSPLDFAAPEERPRLGEFHARRVAGVVTHGPIVETAVLRPNGSVVPIAYVSTEPPRTGQRAIICFFWDISARRSAESALRAEEARRARLFESAPDGIVVSRNGVILDANPAAARMLGYDAARDLAGLSLHTLMSPLDTQAMIERVAAAATGAPKHGPRTYHARRRDGTRVTAEITSVPYEHEGQPAVLGFARDVTDRARLEAQLAQSERLAALGTLAAGVAHEINNPLAVMSLGIQALHLQLDAAKDRLDPAASTDVASLLADLRAGVDRVAAIVRQLRIFSRDDDDPPGPTDVLASLAAAERIAAHEIRHRARVCADYGDVPFATGHARRLEQVFVNLLLNAAQALPEGRADNRIDVRAYVAADGRIAVEIADNGPGIAPDVLPHVFDPFFTTKPVGEGTGLGLAISHGIVTRLGGEIVLESDLGRGTTARVLLAPSGPRAVSGVGAMPRDVASGVRRRILIVDDEPALTASIRLLLGVDHDVTTASGGDAACGLLLRGPSFDVVLCDVMMPVVSGIDVYARVAAARPELLRRFVFMTGGACTPRAAAFLASIPNAVLDKPFDAAELKRLVEVTARPAA